LASGYIYTVSRNQLTCRTGSTSQTRRDRWTEINLGPLS